MGKIVLIKHAQGAPGLRFLGLGPALKPCKGIIKLQELLENHAFWAGRRHKAKLRLLLAGSTAVVSVWQGKRMVAFGRATSDGIYRAVLWDVVVAEDLQGQGLGRQVVEALLETKALREVERVYLMTTQCSKFYNQLGFQKEEDQSLLLREIAKS